MILVGDNAVSCAAIAKAYPFDGPSEGSSGKNSSLCCVWAAPAIPTGELASHAFGHHRYLMHTRVRLAARALRLSYNILFLDTGGCLRGKGMEGEGQAAGECRVDRTCPPSSILGHLSGTSSQLFPLWAMCLWGHRLVLKMAMPPQLAILSTCDPCDLCASCRSHHQ